MENNTAYLHVEVFAPEIKISCDINLYAGRTCSLPTPHFNTTTYGLDSLLYYGKKIWNSLPKTVRSIPKISHSKLIIAIRYLDITSLSGLIYFY